jgi:hypothetical protein
MIISNLRRHSPSLIVERLGNWYNFGQRGGKSTLLLQTFIIRQQIRSRCHGRFIEAMAKKPGMVAVIAN